MLTWARVVTRYWSVVPQVANADGMIGVRKVMTVNLTADHRVIYGAQAAEFLQTLKQVRLLRAIIAPDYWFGPLAC